MATLTAGVTVLILCDSEPTSQQALPRSAILHCSSETTSSTGSWTEVTVPMVANTPYYSIAHRLRRGQVGAVVVMGVVQRFLKHDTRGQLGWVLLCCYSVATTDNNHAPKPPIPHNNMERLYYVWRHKLDLRRVPQG